MKVTTDTCLFGSLAPALPRREEGLHVLDIGTGTGLLALMYAQKVPFATIDAIEIDEEAATQAIENVETSPWKDRITVINADARTFIFSKKYDLIISNPPFYENELKGDNKKKNIAQHNEGLLLPELLALIQKNLATNGCFYLLLPYKRNREIRDLLLKHEFDILKMIFIRPSVKHDYSRIITEGRLKKEELVETKIDEISIIGPDQKYTAVFKKLLTGYYLHL